MINIAFFVCVGRGLELFDSLNEVKWWCKIKFTLNVFYCLHLQSFL